MGKIACNSSGVRLPCAGLMGGSKSFLHSAVILYHGVASSFQVIVFSLNLLP